MLSGGTRQPIFGLMPVSSQVPRNGLIGNWDYAQLKLLSPFPTGCRSRNAMSHLTDDAERLRFLLAA
jgi:hypothetical protein